MRSASATAVKSTMIMEDVEGISLLSHLVNHVEHSGDMIDFIQ